MPVCHHEDLRDLTEIAPAANGAYVYCRCLCGQRRVLPHGQWHRERRRRELEARLQEAAARRGHPPRVTPSYPQVPLWMTELACCSTWHPVTSLPFLCPTCGRTWLEARHGLREETP